MKTVIAKYIYLPFNFIVVSNNPTANNNIIERLFPVSKNPFCPIPS